MRLPNTAVPGWRPGLEAFAIDDPTPPPPDPIVDPRAPYLARRKAFLAANGLKVMKWSGSNLSRLLNSARRGGAEAFRGGLDFRARGSKGYRHGRSAAYATIEAALRDTFAQGVILARDGQPIAVVGSPTHLGREERLRLRTLESLGLGVLVSPFGAWEGPGHLHVRAWIPGSLPEPTEAENLETRRRLGL